MKKSICDFKMDLILLCRLIFPSFSCKLAFRSWIFFWGPFIYYVITFLGFLDPPPPLRNHFFSTENNQKLAFSDPPSPPTSDYVIYEWSLGSNSLETNSYIYTKYVFELSSFLHFFRSHDWTWWCLYHRFATEKPSKGVLSF